jgi:hypothetical protein
MSPLPRNLEMLQVALGDGEEKREEDGSCLHAAEQLRDARILHYVPNATPNYILSCNRARNCNFFLQFLEIL